MAPEGTLASIYVTERSNIYKIYSAALREMNFASDEPNQTDINDLCRK